MKKSTAVAVIAVLLIVAVGAGAYNVLLPPTPVTKTQIRTQTQTVTQTGAVTQTVTQPITQTVTQPVTQTVTTTVTQTPKPVTIELVQPPMAPLTPPPANKRDGVLLNSWNGPAENYDPWHIGYSHMYIIWGMYDTLIMMGPDGKFYPSVATSVIYDPEKLTYTIALRKDVKFHDGSLMTSKDVKASFDRGINVPLRRSYAVAPIGKVEIIDDFTVKFTLKRPYVDFPLELASHTSIHKADRIEKFKEEIINQPPMGTGPFKFVEYVPGDRFVIDRFDDYFAGKAWVKRVVTRYIREASVLSLELQKGGVQISRVFDNRFVPDLKKAGVQLFENPAGYCSVHLTMPLEKPFWRDIDVRKAVNYALNKQSYIDVLEAGIGKVKYGPLRPFMLDYWDPTYKSYDYNVAKAKEHLAKSGFPNGFTVNLLMAGERDEIMAPLIIDQLKAVGITVVPERVDTTVKSRRTLTFGADFFVGGWCGSTPSPGGIFEIWWHSRQAVPFGWNTFHTNYTAISKTIDSLVDNFMAEADVSKRKPMLQQFQTLIMDNALYAPVYYQVMHVAASHQVQGFKIIPHQGIGPNVLLHNPQIGLALWVDPDQPILKTGGM